MSSGLNIAHGLGLVRHATSHVGPRGRSLDPYRRRLTSCRRGVRSRARRTIGLRIHRGSRENWTSAPALRGPRGHRPPQARAARAGATASRLEPVDGAAASRMPSDAEDERADAHPGDHPARAVQRGAERAPAASVPRVARPQFSSGRAEREAEVVERGVGEEQQPVEEPDRRRRRGRRSRTGRRATPVQPEQGRISGPRASARASPDHAPRRASVTSAAVAQHARASGRTGPRPSSVPRIGPIEPDRANRPAEGHRRQAVDHRVGRHRHRRRSRQERGRGRRSPPRARGW